MGFMDQLKQALEKKQAAQHPDVKNDTSASSGKKSRNSTPLSNKPQKKVTGRGR